MEKVALLVTAMRDPRTPWYAKAIVVLTLAYILSPIDIIPDFIPVIGLLDEVIIVPIAYKLVMKWIPEEVKAEVVSNKSQREGHYLIKIFGILIVLTVWLVLIYIGYQFYKTI